MHPSPKNVRLWLGAPAFGEATGDVEYIDRPAAIEDTLQRELAEECGFNCIAQRLFGEAIEFVHASSEQRHFRKHGFFFLADLGETIRIKTETDHHLEWHLPVDAAKLLTHASRAWAVMQFIGARADRGSD